MSSGSGFEEVGKSLVKKIIIDDVLYPDTYLPAVDIAYFINTILQYKYGLNVEISKFQISYMLKEHYAIERTKDSRQPSYMARYLYRLTD